MKQMIWPGASHRDTRQAAHHLLGVVAALDQAVQDVLGRRPEGEVVDGARLGVAAPPHDPLHQQLVGDLRGQAAW
jgi:hypothetical protein